MRGDPADSVRASLPTFLGPIGPSKRQFPGGDSRRDLISRARSFGGRFSMPLSCNRVEEQNALWTLVSAPVSWTGR
jgi:hypothetical protein